TDSGTAVIDFYIFPLGLATTSAIEEIAAEFNRSQTAVQVHVTNQILPGANGFFSIEQMADQFDCFSALPLLPEHTALVYSLTPLLAADETGLADDFYPNLLAQFTVEGELYGLPINVSPTIVYYNAELLAAKGIAPPDLNWELADLLTLASQSIDPDAGVTHGVVPFQGDIVSWFLAEQGVYPYDVSANPPTVNFDDPNILNALVLLVQLHNNGVVYQELGLGSQEWNDNYNLQEQLVVSGHAPFWGDVAGLHGGFVEGEIPEFVQPAAMPVFNGRIAPPSTTGLYISRQTADPQACWDWLTFLSGQPAAPRSVPARISVAESAAWETVVGVENAAVFRTSLARHAAQSRVQTPSTINTFPLSRWWADLLNAAYAGEPIEPLLAAAQQKGQAYVACMSELTTPTLEQMDACAKEADPEYKTLQELR
ncbi:MAG: extracellular solute-binding protein, partial [Anaerolineales bacterium]|nr:extracellular solute-binding protein [Anaerolineales bacterium]